MPASDLKLDLLIKLLKMTTSQTDNEALLFMRKANAVMSEVGLDWEALLKGKVTVIADPFASVASQPAPSMTPTARPQSSQPRSHYTSQQPPRPSAPQPPPQPWTAPRISNRKAGRCHLCGKHALPGDAIATKLNQWTNSWVVECNPGQCWPPGYTPPKPQSSTTPTMNQRQAKRRARQPLDPDALLDNVDF